MCNFNNGHLTRDVVFLPECKFSCILKTKGEPADPDSPGKLPLKQTCWANGDSVVAIMTFVALLCYNICARLRLLHEYVLMIIYYTYTAFTVHLLFDLLAIIHFLLSVVGPGTVSKWVSV